MVGGFYWTEGTSSPDWKPPSQQTECFYWLIDHDGSRIHHTTRGPAIVRVGLGNNSAFKTINCEPWVRVKPTNRRY